MKQPSRHFLCYHFPLKNRIHQQQTTTYFQIRNRSSSSGRKKIHEAWLHRRSKDIYTKKAQDEGLPSRSLFKLEQIDSMAKKLHDSQKKRQGERRSSKQKKGIFEKGDCVIELGAAPGGWSLYTSQKIKPSGTLISIDILPLDPTIKNTIDRNCTFQFVQGDFRQMQQGVIDEIVSSCSNNTKADVIVSDMAANFTGDKMTDALRTMTLCEDALCFSIGSTTTKYHDHYNQDPLSSTYHGLGFLRVGGTFLCKFFSCGQEHENDLIKTVKHHFEYMKILKPGASRKESAEKYLLAMNLKG